MVSGLEAARQADDRGVVRTGLASPTSSVMQASRIVQDRQHSTLSITCVAPARVRDIAVPIGHTPAARVIAAGVPAIGDVDYSGAGSRRPASQPSS